MKHILKEGEISELVSDSGRAGWSREVHLVRYKNKKYVLRKSISIEKAKHYENISKKLERYGFLPKFLGRYGKNVIYEYIDGRDLRKKESLNIIKQIGVISAYINKVKVRGSINNKFYKQLKSNVSGKFLDKEVKPIINKQQENEIKKIYKYLKRKCKPKLMLDINDINPENFRLRKGKVYLIDIEGVKPRIKAFGIGKAFIKWFKTPNQRKAFIDGYNSILSAKFLTEGYLDFIFLSFIIQEINYMAYYGPKYKPRNKMRFEELTNLIKKYDKILR